MRPFGFDDIALIGISALIVWAAKGNAQTATAPVPNPVRAETIEGRVTTDSGAAIVGAEVIATRAPDRAFKTTVTDATGKFSILFTEGTGDYLVHVSAFGRQAARKRITRAGSDSVLHVDFQLRSSVQQLETVRVEATKPKPSRESGIGNKPGSSEKIVDGVRGAVPPGLAGDLAARASTIPGVAVTPGGISVLGLGSNQNRTTLNGMSFAGASVPRDARVITRVASTSYDPAQGWFGGAEQSVDLEIGDLFSSRKAHIVLDAPFLQYGDPLSSSSGQRFTNVALSVGGAGSFDEDKYAYNYGVDASRRQSDVAGLETASPKALLQEGVSPDSVSRFLEILSGSGFRIANETEAPKLVNDRASFIFRLDHSPFDWKTFTESNTTWGVIGYGNVARSQRIGVSPLGTVDHGAESNEAIGSLQAIYSGLINEKYLTDARSSVTIAHRDFKPQQLLPDGSVLVTSFLSDGSLGLTQLGFGGNGTLDRNATDFTWESQLQNLFYFRGRAGHLIRFTADARLDGFDHQQSGSRLGTFVFSSLADLASNHPASFSRTLSSAKVTGGEWNAFAALSDTWRKSSTLRILYGLRVEGNRFTTAPNDQPDLRNAFGTNTTNVPNTLHVSPRLGFTWLRQRADFSRMTSTIGEFYRNPPSYLRGGIGEFRGMLSPNLVEAALQSGEGVTRIVRCDGSAAPSPNWESFVDNPAVIPTTCVPDTLPIFTDQAPAEHLFASGYTAPRSWRANIGYGFSRGIFAFNVEGILSLNLNQSGFRNLNFSNKPQFVVSDEGRPVFVSASSIVPNSGIVSPVESRLFSQFGPVTQEVSNLRTVSRQLTITATPDLHSGWRFLQASYTLSSMTAYETGFNGTTFLSPTIRERARGEFNARHQLLLQGGLVRAGLVLTVFTRIQSGFPFTPMIADDVNGDGLSNDRAFIFDPSSAADPGIALATRALLDRSSSSVRNCLLRQTGRAARWNSCDGPWAATMDAQITRQKTIPLLRHSAEISLALSNPLGGIDRLLHGASAMQGWGSSAAPDQNLYFVRGFDSVARRFKYEVNPQFGDTRGAGALARSPFRVTLDVSMDIGTPMPQQQLTRWVEPGRNGHPGPRLSMDELKKRYQRSVTDPYGVVLNETDSLLLSRDQVDSLKAIQSRYVAKMDSLWTSLAQHMAGLGDHFDAADALRHQEEATDKGWEIAKVDVQKSLPTVLSPVQLQLVPGIVKYLLKATGRVRIRIFSYGS